MPDRRVDWKPYPRDGSDHAKPFVALHLTLCREDALQRVHDLRAVFSDRGHDLRALLRLGEVRAPAPTAAVPGRRTLQSTHESGARASYDEHDR